MERLRNWRRCAGMQFLSEEEAEKLLIKIAQKGKIVGERPGNAVEIEHNKLYIVAKQEGSITIVITFNGDYAWRKWYRRQRFYTLRYNRKVKAALS
jgi:hypothetical protein